MHSPVFLLLVAFKLMSVVKSQSNTGCYMDLCIVIDDSGSIRGSNKPGQPDNWNLTIDFLKNFAGLGNIGPDQTHVAVVSFDDKATLEFNLNEGTTLNNVLTGIDNIKYDGGSTNMTGGLREARVNVFDSAYGDRPDAPNILILITDGQPNVEKDGLMDEVNRTKQLGIRIAAIGVTDGVDDNLLKSMVSPPVNESYAFVTDQRKLNESIAFGLLACTPKSAASTLTTIWIPYSMATLEHLIHYLPIFLLQFMISAF